MLIAYFVEDEILSKYFISIYKSLFRGIHIQSSESNRYANFYFSAL